MTQENTYRRYRKGQPKPGIQLAPAIESGRINREDGVLALDFCDYYETLNKLGASSRKKYRYSLGEFLAVLKERGVTIATMKEADALALIRFVQETPFWGESSRADYWDKWCRFYAWAQDRYGQNWDERVKEKFVGDKKYIYRKDKNKIERQRTIPPETFVQLIQAEPSEAYKAFFSVAIETGARGCELLSLKIKDLEINAEGLTIHLRYSKTFTRPIPLVFYAPPYLMRWLAIHPNRGNPEAMLFTNKKGKAMTHPAVAKRLRIALAELGITGRGIGLHTLRRSRATELAGRGMSGFQMSRMFGWTQGSNMPQTYINEASIDVRKALLEAHGLEHKDITRAVGRTCLHCGAVNTYEAESCSLCALPLDPAKLSRIKLASDEAGMQVYIESIVKEKYGRLIEQLSEKVTAGLIKL